MRVIPGRAELRILLGVLLTGVLAAGAVAGYLQAAPGRSALAAVLLASLASLGAGALLARSSVREVRDLAAAAQRMAEGKLDQRIRIDSPGEVGALARALNALADQLRTVAGDADEERSALSAVLANMDDGVLILSADGRVILANPAAERILQVPEGQSPGRSFVEVLRDHELVQFVRDCLGAASTGGARMMDAGLPRRHLRIQARPLADGRGLVVLQDLTEIRRAETVRRDFVANVSHELRTPLASLKALVETLQDGALDDPPAARGFLERMSVEVDGLTQLVRELLELSRIESGRASLHVASADVRSVVVAAAERLAAQADRAGLDLAVDVASDLPPAPLDSDKVQQALINLIHNAIKFTPPGGRIQVSAQGARVRLDGGFELLPAEVAGPVPTHVVLTVADTGVGVPVEEQPRIFERFYKADKARSGGGTGLGLAIVKHVAEAHGGRVWVESVEGQGATFRIALPLGPLARAGPPSPNR